MSWYLILPRVARTRSAPHCARRQPIVVLVLVLLLPLLLPLLLVMRRVAAIRREIETRVQRELGNGAARRSVRRVGVQRRQRVFGAHQRQRNARGGRCVPVWRMRMRLRMGMQGGRRLRVRVGQVMRALR